MKIAKDMRCDTWRKQSDSIPLALYSLSEAEAREVYVTYDGSVVTWRKKTLIEKIADSKLTSRQVIFALLFGAIMVFWLWVIAWGAWIILTNII